MKRALKISVVVCAACFLVLGARNFAFAFFIGLVAGAVLFVSLLFENKK